MNRLKRLLVPFAVALLAACGSLPPSNLQAPEVGVSDLTLTDIGLDRLRFLVMLETVNPNEVDVPLTNVRLDLTVFDVALAQGTVVERQVLLPARGRQQVPVEFTVPTSKLLDVLDRFRSGNWDNFNYRLAGRANWGNTPFSVPFERSGNLDTLKRLAIIFGGG
jgi:LEA14-like dessication related protein